MPKRKRSFTGVVLQVLSLMFFALSMLMILAPEKVFLFNLPTGRSGRISLIVLQFLGTSYFLLGCILYLINKSKIVSLRSIVIMLNLFGLFNFFLLIKCNSVISLPDIYFVLQILLQILFFCCLIEQFRKRC